MYVCVSVCLCVCVSVCLCVYVCMNVCMHAWMYACMHVCMHACMHVCMYPVSHVPESFELGGPYHWGGPGIRSPDSYILYYAHLLYNDNIIS